MQRRDVRVDNLRGIHRRPAADARAARASRSTLLADARAALRATSGREQRSDKRRAEQARRARPLHVASPHSFFAVVTSLPQVMAYGAPIVPTTETTYPHVAPYEISVGVSLG